MKLKELYSKIEKPLKIIAAASALSIILTQLEFNLLEASLYDLRMSFGTQRNASSEIVLITVDDQTTDELNDFAPLPLNLHTDFLNRIKEYQPRAVGYLINMNYVNQANPDLFLDHHGKDFIRAAESLQASNTTFMLGTPFDVNGEVLPPFPLSSLDHAISVIHKDGNVFSEDKVTRRAITKLYNKPSFHLEMALRTDKSRSSVSPRGSFYVPEVDGEYFFFRYHGDPSKKPYRQYSFVDVLKGRVPIDFLKDKVVLVGTMIRENPADFAKTPFAKNSFTSPKIVVHANILDSIIHDDGVILTPTWVNGLFTLVLTSFVLWFVLTSTPLAGVFTTVGLTVLFLIFNHILFKGVVSQNGIWVPESQTLVGIFLSYYLAVPYRLIQEYKTRWDYQRRNQLLTQVEELKTNFLSLVTHDLKTPVARIQGLAEMLIKKVKGLPEKQDQEESKKALTNIVYSTDELNRFISSILELTKIESNRVQIKLESKDINRIIESSISTLQTQADSKKISIEKNLDTLFPIKLDPSLISKVLNNLIDNAIKYSPEGSVVIVSSQENEDFIEISVKDQGIGIRDEERKDLFTRFYRAKNDTTTKIPGTGLGLYLTKYFVEAHRGSVEIESEEDRGSTFTIRLPMDLKQSEIAHVLKTESVPTKGRKIFQSSVGLKVDRSKVTSRAKSSKKLKEQKNA